MDKALLHERPQVDRRLLPLHIGDLHDPPVHRRGSVVARDIVPADHVEDDIGAPSTGRRQRPLDEVLGPIVDACVRPEPLTLPRLVVRPGRRDNARAEGLGERDRRRADAGGSSMDQQSFSRLARCPGRRHWSRP